MCPLASTDAAQYSEAKLRSVDYCLRPPDVIAGSSIVAYWLLLGYAKPQWTFSAPGWLDPWYYVGYGYNLMDPTFEAENYKISRMPWLLVQLALRQLFQDTTASLAIAVLPLILITLAAFVYLRKYYSTAISLASAQSVVLFTPAILRSSGGADYHALFSTGCIMLGLAALSRAGRKSQAVGLIFVALGIHANIVAINLVPLLAIVPILSWSQADDQTPFLRSLLSPTVKIVSRFGLAFLLVTASLSGASLALNRPALFFLPQFRLAQSFVNDAQNQAPWWQQWSFGWVWNSPILILSVITVASFSLFAFYRPRKRQADEANAAAWIGGLLFTTIVWSLWQTIGQTAWQPSYFSVPVLAPLLFAVVFWTGIVVSRVVTSATRSARLVFAGTLVALLASPILGLSLHGLASNRNFRFGFEQTALFIIFVGVAAYMVTRFSPAAPVLGSLGLAFALFALPTSEALGPSRFALTTSGEPRCIARQEAFEWIVAAHKTVAAFPGSTDQTVIWFDETPGANFEFCGETYSIAYLGYSLVSTGFRYAQWPPWPMVSIGDIDTNQLMATLEAEPRNRLIVLSRDTSGTDAAEFAARLALAHTGSRPILFEEIPISTHGPSMWSIQLGQ